MQRLVNRDSDIFNKLWSNKSRRDKHSIQKTIKIDD